MSNHSARKLILCLASAWLVACTSTASEPNKHLNTNTQSKATILKPQVARANVNSGTAITLEKIMSDPDWIGRRPEGQYWGDDSASVYFSQKREGSVVRDRWSVNLSALESSKAHSQEIALEQLHRHDYANRVLNSTKETAAWLSDGNIFVKSLANGKVRQFTRGITGISGLQFLLNGDLAYRSKNGFYSINLESGLTALVAKWKFADKPTAVKAPKDYIAEEQQNLIGYIQTKRKQSQQRFEQHQALKQSAVSAPNPFYLPKKFRTDDAKLSPDGSKVVLMITEDVKSRTKKDIMPHYVQEDGRIAAISARRRVADAKPVKNELWLLDIKSGTPHALSFESLPGYNDDVLADVKRENAKALGKDYEVNRLPRNIQLQMSWGRPTETIVWHASGSQVGVMLEAWDNKDRWLVTVDFDKKALVTQSRLHDDAWINYRFNTFGWLHKAESLYYLSEESGYSNLYLKPLKGNSQALVSGKFEVDGLTLTHSDEYIYYQANKPHPGMYEVYRVNTQSKRSERLTQLHGNTDYQLSPDGQKLLLVHSKVNMPPELYVQDAKTDASASQVTFTVSDEFLSMPWVVPEIVPVKSSHVEVPVYARLYQSQSAESANENQSVDEKHRAVIFSHGAGYLQNSHLGWSLYFREFMFHSMLVQQGYVVMDMDYRASAGYGRDWRTAIYRHMGKPEIEDLEDGVNWLVKNAQVDRNRIGTYGGSYGGFMTFMAMFNKPELFQAGAALRPVSDWAHYNEEYTSNILNTPDVDPIAYERSSPIYFAEGLQKTMLINAPMVDDNVFFVDVVRLVQRLIELEKQNFETAIYPVEPHGFVQPGSWLDEYRRIFKLFEENL